MELLKTKADLDRKIKEMQEKAQQEEEAQKSKEDEEKAKNQPQTVFKAKTDSGVQEGEVGGATPMATQPTAQVAGTAGQNLIIVGPEGQKLSGERGPGGLAGQGANAEIQGLAFQKVPRPLERAEPSINLGQIELNAQNATLSPLVKELLKITGLCIEDMSNLTHRLLHVDQFTILKDFIKTHPLNLSMALTRCNNSYGKNAQCEPYLGTMAVKKCPRGYMRVGCCECTIPCPRGYWSDGGGLFCFKSDPIQGRKYGNLDDCQKDTSNPRECELYGVSFFTKSCPPNYDRNGDLLCMQRCPLGWPDYGMKCLKVGNVRTGMPTVWQPGDELTEVAQKAEPTPQVVTEEAQTRRLGYDDIINKMKRIGMQAFIGDDVRSRVDWIKDVSLGK